MENGHTLHLVARQPAQSQDSSGTSAGEASGNTTHRGTVFAIAALLSLFFRVVVMAEIYVLNCKLLCAFMIWQ